MANNFFESAPAEQPSFGLPDWAQRPKAQAVDTGGAVPFQSEFMSASEKYGVPFNVLMGLAEQESTFNPTAVGVPTKYGRAKGMMQYIDSTAARMGINPYDPAQSIDAAAKQLRERLDKGYSMQEAVQAHFGGDDRRQWGPKTAQYGKDVLGRAEKFLGGGKPISAGQPTQQQEQPQTQAGQIAQDYPPAQSAMENMDQTRQRTQALFDDLNKEEPGRYRVLTDEEMQQLAQHITPEMEQKAFEAGKPIEITIPELIQPGQTASAPTPQKQPEGNKNGNLLTDAITLLDSGLNTAAKDVQELVGKIPVIGKPIVDAADRFDRWANGKSTQELFKAYDESIDKRLTPEMLAARRKSFVIEPGDDLGDGKKSTGYNFGPAWSDPRAYMSGILESAPEMALTMGGSGRLAQMAYRRALASGASREVAAKAAARTATVAGGILEGGLSGAQSSREVRDDILKMSPQQLANSDAMKSLMGDDQSQASFEKARAQLAENAASQAFMLAGISTGIFGGMGDRALAKIITNRAGGRVKAALAGAIGEGVFEEMPQSATQQMSQNYAMQDADPNTPLMKGVANQAASGLAVGGLMGGGMGAAAPRVGADERPAPAQQPVEQAQPTVDQPTVDQPQEVKPSGPLARAVQSGTQQVVDTMTAQAQQNPSAAENSTPDMFMGPVGAETTVVPADDPTASFPAIVQEYRNGNAVVADQNGEILEFGPHEVVRPDAQQQEAAPMQEQAAEEEQPAEQPRQPKTIGEMTEPELRDRLKYLHQQAKSSGGWNERLSKARREVEKAIDSKSAPTQGELNAEAANLPDERSAQPEVSQIAQPDNAPAVQPDESGAAAQPQRVVHSADEPAAGSGADAVSGSAATNPDPSLNKDGSQKWFGTERKANEYLSKKDIAGTHEIRLVDRRFEIHPKGSDSTTNQTASDVKNMFTGIADGFSDSVLDRAAKAGGLKLTKPESIKALRDVGDRYHYTENDDGSVTLLGGRDSSGKWVGQSGTLTNEGTTEKASSTKGKSGPRYNRVKKLLGAEEGNIITPQEDIGYTTAGRNYRIDEIGKSGIVQLTNVDTGSRTTINLAELERANSRKSGFNRVESVAETAPAEQEQQQSGEWQSFDGDSGTLGIPRAEMPQVKAEHRGPLVNFLEARGVTRREGMVPADTLKPTQAEFSPERVSRAAENTDSDRSILVSSDGYVLDGHHQWLAARKNGDNVKAIVFDSPIRDLLPLVHEFPSSLVDTASEPKAADFRGNNNSSTENVRENADSSTRTTIRDTAGKQYEHRGEPLPKKGLATANIGSNGAVYVNRPSGVHFQLSEKYPVAERGEWQREGFVTPDGQFLDRTQALAWVNQNEGEIKPSDNMSNQLDAVDYREQAGKRPVKNDSSEYGASNKLVSQDRAAELRQKLKAKFSQLNSGLDPEILAIGTELAVFHLEAGVRKFADFARTMASDLDVPVKRLRPYLRSWYNGGRDMMEDSNISIEGMDSPDTVRAELAKLDDNEATAAPPKAEASEPKSSDDSDKQPRYQLFNQATGGGSNAEFMSWVSGMKSEYTRARGIDNSVPGGATINDQADFTNFIREKVNAERKQQSRPTGAMDDMVSQFDNEVTPNVSGTRSGVEPDSGNAGTPVSSNESPVLDGSGRNNRSNEQPGQRSEPARSAGQRNQRVSEDGAAARRNIRDQPIHQPDGQFHSPERAAGSPERVGSRSDSPAGSPVEQQRRAAIADNAHATGAGELSSRLKAQKSAKGKPTAWADKDSIDNALPLLLPDQRTDVLKIEQRHQVAPGILVTNGTGTGKTASGLGAALRHYNAGKKNIAVIVPTDKVASDWVKFAGMLDMPLHQLNGIDDAGKGPIVTTYANFGQNDALYSRQWDLIIPDESHYLSSNAAGESTAALDKLRGLTNHPDGFQHWLIGNNKELHDELTEQRAILSKMNSSQAGYQAQEQKVERLNQKWRAIEQPARQEWQQRWEEQRDIPKIVFLSATPFAYVKNTDYAEGYLFNHTPPADRYSDSNNGSGYNSGSDRERFYMEHFGYRMRYNKLTQPEAGVNSELMEQNFNQYLKDTGALIGRRLEVPFDYDRRFQLIDDAAGKKLDNALRFLNEAENGIYRPIYDEVMRTFDYQRRMFLLESMKARAAVPIIRQHLAMGRKVVVFHDYNKGGGFSPFAEALSEMKDLDMRATASELFQRPEFRINFGGLKSAIATIQGAFPDVLLFNGTVSKTKRRINADFFNADKSRKNLILVQSDAGREGVSLHDTTGKYQRVEINLGMPTRPVAATQIEGRIYRTGQASDAIFRYMTTGTSWEASTFASKIAERAATAENLALGNEARGLKQSFIDAYNEAEPMEASRDDGKGGKERDKAASEVVSPFDRAKTFYYAQQKNTKRRDQREGQDYFATPEPVGFKMVEWANIKPGDKVLEPSAGHGAIARFFPEQSDVTMIEPSYDLSQRAALSNGTARIINGRFEDLSRANKYDAIVMNPPFGTGGKTAYEHLAKAAKHLRQGGRIVALVPRGGISERRFDQFFGSDESKGLHLVARIKMPWSTFERAGTKVATEVLVFERHDKSDGNIIPVRPDLSSAENVNELFDRIEGLTLPERQPLTADEAIANAADGTMYSVPEKGEAATVADVESSGPVAKALLDSGRLVTHDTPPAPEYANAGGWIDQDGKIHLALYNLKPEDVQPTLMHELFHAGMRTIGGDRRWVNLMDRLGQYYRAAQNGGAKNEWTAAVERIQNAQAQGDGMNDAARDHVVEELGAYAVENFEKMPAGIRKWAESIIGTVKNYLQQTFGLQLGKVTPGQLRALAAGAIRNQAAPATSTSFSTPEASKPPKEAEKQSWFNQRWDEVSDLPDNMLKTVMPALLHFTPGRFILKRVGKDIPALGRYADVKLQMDTLRDEWHAKTDKEAQKWLKYRVKNPAENAELMDIMHDSTLSQVDPSEDFITTLTGIDLAALREKKRGDPAFDAATEKAENDAKRKADYATLEERYKKLSPEGKQIYKRIRDLYTKLADTQEQVIIDNMEKAMDIRARQARREFDDEMQHIQDEGLKGKEKDEAIEKAKKKLQNNLRRDAWNRRARINQLRSEFESNRLAGPYFPLARFGDFFVTARKKGSGEVVSFSRMETAFEQTRVKKQLQKEGYDVETGVISKDDNLKKQIPADFVARVEDLLKGIEGSEKTQDQVWQMYLQTMPDYSLRKARIHRKGRAGFEEDALRAFASHMFHGSHQLARMK
ncbi:PLxRFG domain-containing protein, partial [Leclercia sp.]|uniref:PLxRFG domain-containing protein n=1 Tax=Leclercia sp. TaxID=1898428 RepID=UPI0028BD2CA7